jgi:hypothetical protein
MRRFLVIGLLLIAGCTSSEEEARKLLTKGQQLQMQYKSVEALEQFEDIAQRFPQTAAATDALRLAKPLSDQKELALVACASFFLDTGQDPTSEDDLTTNRGAFGWKGPYARTSQMGEFAKWAVQRKCAR